LKQYGGRESWLRGGGDLVTRLFNEVDEVILEFA
jgi:hypothetical protein